MLNKRGLETKSFWVVISFFIVLVLVFSIWFAINPDRFKDIVGILGAGGNTGGPTGEEGSETGGVESDVPENIKVAFRKLVLAMSKEYKHPKDMNPKGNHRGCYIKYLDSNFPNLMYGEDKKARIKIKYDSAHITISLLDNDGKTVEKANIPNKTLCVVGGKATQYDTEGTSCDITRDSGIIFTSRNIINKKATLNVGENFGYAFIGRESFADKCDIKPIYTFCKELIIEPLNDQENTILGPLVCFNRARYWALGWNYARNFRDNGLLFIPDADGKSQHICFFATAGDSHSEYGVYENYLKDGNGGIIKSNVMWECQEKPKDEN